MALRTFQQTYHVAGTLGAAVAPRAVTLSAVGAIFVLAAVAVSEIAVAQVSPPSWTASPDVYKVIAEDARIEDRNHFEALVPRIYELGGKIPDDMKAFHDLSA